MITTIKFKDIIKYLAITTGIIVIVVFVARYFLNKKEIGKNEKQNNSIKKHTLISCINISIPISKTVKNSNNNSTEEKTSTIFLAIVDIIINKLYFLIFDI